MGHHLVVNRCPVRQFPLCKHQRRPKNWRLPSVPTTRCRLSTFGGRPKVVWRTTQGSPLVRSVRDAMGNTACCQTEAGAQGPRAKPRWFNHSALGWTPFNVKGQTRQKMRWIDVFFFLWGCLKSENWRNQEWTSRWTRTIVEITIVKRRKSFKWTIFHNYIS